MKNDKPFVSQYDLGGCPDCEHLESYAKVELVGREEADVRKHVDGCLPCWTYVQSWAGEQAKKHLSVVK